VCAQDPLQILEHCEGEGDVKKWGLCRGVDWSGPRGVKKQRRISRDVAATAVRTEQFRWASRLRGCWEFVEHSLGLEHGTLQTRGMSTPLDQASSKTSCMTLMRFPSLDRKDTSLVVSTGF